MNPSEEEKYSKTSKWSLILVFKKNYFQRRPTYPVGRSGACASSGPKHRRSASGTHIEPVLENAIKTLQKVVDVRGMGKKWDAS